MERGAMCGGHTPIDLDGCHVETLCNHLEGSIGNHQGPLFMRTTYA